MSTVENDPVFQPNIDNYEEEFNQYFSQGADGVVFGDPAPPTTSEPDITTPTDSLPDEGLN